jgi:hypothetical protein
MTTMDRRLISRGIADRLKEGEGEKNSDSWQLLQGSRTKRARNSGADKFRRFNRQSEYW